MKHYSTGAKRRNKRHTGQAGSGKQSSEVNTTARQDPARPTPEQMAKGAIQMPTGIGKEDRPAHNAREDMIGALFHAGKLTPGQEQAARLFQRLRADYLQEIGVKGYRSCLDSSQGGHDASDGNPEVIAAYRDLERAIGRVKTAVLIVETEKGPGQNPVDLPALRNALNCVMGY